MKKIILTTAIMLICFLSSSAQTEIKSKIEKVTVFPTSALVEKSAKINLQKGENKFIITDNATLIDNSDLHFSTAEDYFITSVDTKTVNQSKDSKAKQTFNANVYAKYTALSNQVNQTSQKLKQNNYLIKVYDKQLSALDNIKAIKNTQSIDTLKTIKDQFEYQRTEGINLKTQIDKLVKENIELQYQINRQTQELEELVKKNNGSCDLTAESTNIMLTIYSNKVMTSTLNYCYYVYNVHSSYKYDVMLNENLHQAIFNLKSSVYQGTSENWKDCEIVFSTNEAGYAGQDSELPTWYLDNRRPKQVYRSLMTTNNVMMAESVDMADNKKNKLAHEEEFETDDLSLEATEIVELTLSKEYTLTTKQAIGSGSNLTIPLAFDTTKADFKHFSTPKNIEKVYYTALLPNWEDLGLQNVSCNIFLNGKYVAKSYINTSSTKDTLQFSAGEDNNVKIARKVNRTSPDKGFLSSNVEETVTVTLVVKNAKNSPIDLSIKDQIPISQNSDIKITDVKTNEGTLNSNTGIIKWNIKMTPKESKELKFSYTVKYPKDYSLELN